jgi:endonuclease-3
MTVYRLKMCGIYAKIIYMKGNTKDKLNDNKVKSNDKSVEVNYNIANNDKILAELERLYHDAKPALHYSTPYELLVAVMLSAQCTDERVNKVTAELFKEHNTPQKMLELTQTELEGYIFSCGLYHSKAKHILSASADIVEKYNGIVPCDHKTLKTLAGVGQKTANVVFSVAFGGDAIAVDTHVFRVANRLGIAEGNTPAKVEEGLKKAIPQENWSKAHHWLIYHGRKVCHSQSPDCENCTLKDYCKFKKTK